MKRLLRRSALCNLMILLASVLLNNTAIGQSCSNNNLGFNGNTATNALTICSGTTGTTLDADDPAGTETYAWEVASSISGPYSAVSPNPGSVEDWMISSTYYNTAGIYYFRRVVSANGGCDGNSDVAVLTVKYSPLVTNNGGNSANCTPTGYILLYGSGGVTPYTYSIDGITYQAGNTFSNLAAGTYTGYVKDNIGCVGTKTNIVITAAAAITVTANPRAASTCANDGSIELYRTGGIGPYTYSLDDVTYQVSNTFNGLADGTYTGWVQDASGCKGTLAGIVVGKAAAVTVTFAKSNTTSCGNTGAIQLYPGGGTPGYTYSLDDITYQAASLFTGLAAGTYTVWAKDSKGCKVSVGGIVIGTDPGTTLSVTAYPHSTSSCTNNGYIQVFKAGGVGPFTYSKDDVTYQVSNNLTGLAAGTYTVWAKDANGCKGSLAGVVVTQLSAVTVTQVHTSSSACVNDGTITMTASNSSSPYTYSIDDITYQSSRIFTGVAPGSYTAWVKDAGGCKASVNLTISTNTINVTPYSGNATSCGSNNGSIQLFRTGGTGPYTYSINGTTYQSSNAFTGLTPATYTGYVKDSKGCVGTANVYVGPQSSTITLTSATGSDAQAACKNAAITSITYAIGGGGTNASITSGALPSGVTGTYSAGVFTISGTSTVAGVYNYTVSTTGTCTQVSASGTITVGTAPTATFTKTMASSCGGGTDGTITVTATSGVAPFTYTWTGQGGFSANTPVVTGLATGDYTAVIADASTCTTTIPDISIWQAQQPTVSNNGNISASCSATGVIILYGSYGVAPYTYSVDGTNYQASNTFNNLAPGTYTGYVQDLSGCVGTKLITVGVAAPINVTASQRAATSCGTANGAIQLFRTGGIGPYTYSLDGTNYQVSPLFPSLLPGLYRGYVKDSKNCVASLPNISVGPGGCPIPPPVTRSAITIAPDAAVENKLINISVYPNPSATEFTLVLASNNTEKAVITVTDIAGRKVYQSEANGKQQLRFGSNLKPGMYIVQVMQGDKKQSIKITKE